MKRNGLTVASYDRIAVSIHWLTAVLVIAAFVMGPEGSEEGNYSTGEELGRQIHESLGAAVLCLTLARLVWKFFAVAPQLPPAPRWMEVASKVVQWALYVLLVATPLTAVAGAWLEGHALDFGILGTIPPLVPESRGIGEAISELHGVLGDALVWLAGFHAAAALVHHFFLRDEVLLSMLPVRWLRRPP